VTIYNSIWHQLVPSSKELGEPFSSIYNWDDKPQPPPTPATLALEEAIEEAAKTPTSSQRGTSQADNADTSDKSTDSDTSESKDPTNVQIRNSPIYLLAPLATVCVHKGNLAAAMASLASTLAAIQVQVQPSSGLPTQPPTPNQPPQNMSNLFNCYLKQGGGGRGGGGGGGGGSGRGAPGPAL
jgi:hypothetical protein